MVALALNFLWLQMHNLYDGIADKKLLGPICINLFGRCSIENHKNRIKWKIKYNDNMVASKALGIYRDSKCTAPQVPRGPGGCSTGKGVLCRNVHWTSWKNSYYIYTPFYIYIYIHSYLYTPLFSYLYNLQQFKLTLASSQQRVHRPTQWQTSHHVSHAAVMYQQWVHWHLVPAWAAGARQRQSCCAWSVGTQQRIQPRFQRAKISWNVTVLLALQLTRHWHEEQSWGKAKKGRLKMHKMQLEWLLIKKSKRRWNRWDRQKEEHGARQRRTSARLKIILFVGSSMTRWATLNIWVLITRMNRRLITGGFARIGASVKWIW